LPSGWRYYGDPEWVEGHLADLAHQFKDVRPFVKVDFTVPASPEPGRSEAKMSLTYRRRPDRLAEAAKLDGRWVLVTNQRPEASQSLPDYLDWMWGVYKPVVSEAEPKPPPRRAADAELEERPAHSPHLPAPRRCHRRPLLRLRHGSDGLHADRTRLSGQPGPG